MLVKPEYVERLAAQQNQPGARQPELLDEGNEWS